MFKSVFSSRRRQLERENVKLLNDLSDSNIRLKERTEEFVATEKILLARVEKSLKDQLELKTRLSRRDEKNKDLSSCLVDLKCSSTDCQPDPNQHTEGIRAQLVHYKGKVAILEAGLLNYKTLYDEATAKLGEKISTKLPAGFRESAKHDSHRNPNLTNEIADRSANKPLVNVELDTSHKKLTKVEQQLKEINDEREFIAKHHRKADRRNYSDQLVAAANLMRDMQTEKDILLSENSELSSTIFDMDVEIHNTKNRLQIVQDELRDVRADNVSTELISSATVDLNAKLRAATALMEEIQSVKAAQKLEIGSLTDALNAADLDLEEAQKKLQKIESVNKSLLKERDDLSLQVKGCRRESLALNQIVSESKQKELWQSMEGDLQQKRVAEGKREIDEELTDTRAQLAASEVRLKDVIKKAKSVEDTLTAQLASTTKLMKDLEREKDIITAESVNLSATLNTVDIELEASTKKLQKSEKESKLLLAEKDSVSLQLRRCEKKLQEATRVAEEIKQKEVWQNMERDMEQKQIKRRSSLADEEAVGLGSQLKSVQEQLTAATATLSEQQSDITSLQSRLNAAKAVSVDIFHEKEFLKVENANVSAALVSAETEVETACKNVTKLDEKIKILIDEKESLALQLRGSQVELTRLNQGLDECKQKELWQKMDQDLQSKQKVEKVEKKDAVDEEVKTLKAHLKAIKHELSCRKSDIDILVLELSAAKSEVKS